MESDWMNNELCEWIEPMYGVKIKAILPMRSVAGLVTDCGKWMCKRYDGHQGVDTERLSALAVVKSDLADAGFGVSYLENKEGNPFSVYRDTLMTMEPWVPGHHADFSSAVDRVQAVKAVARLHQMRVRIPYTLQFTPTIFQKLSYRLQRASDVVERGYLVGISDYEWDTWRRTAQQVLRHVTASELQARVTADRKKGILCHRDLAPHNILVQAGRPAQLIDYDLAGLDSPVYDLYQLFGHMSFFIRSERAWQEPLLDAYASIAYLSPEHRELLSVLQAFPAQLLREIGDIPENRSQVMRHKASIRVRHASRVEQRRVGIGS